MTKLGIGIVGVGFAADIHARAFQDLARLSVELVGVASRTEARAVQFASRFGDSAAQLRADGVGAWADDGHDLYRRSVAYGQ